MIGGIKNGNQLASPLIKVYFKYKYRNFYRTAISAQRSPSIAALIIPPA